MSIKITVLVDDINGAEAGYILSYGFAALIEKDEKKILFDAGTKERPLINNLKAYGWHCAWGETVKSVDFVHEDGRLLQIKLSTGLTCFRVDIALIKR